MDAGRVIFRPRCIGAYVHAGRCRPCFRVIFRPRCNDTLLVLTMCMQVVVALEAGSFAAWEAKKFEPEESFLAAGERPITTYFTCYFTKKLMCLLCSFVRAGWRPVRDRLIT